MYCTMLALNVMMERLAILYSKYWQALSCNVYCTILAVIMMLKGPTLLQNIYCQDFHHHSKCYHSAKQINDLV